MRVRATGLDIGIASDLNNLRHSWRDRECMQAAKRKLFEGIWKKRSA